MLFMYFIRTFDQNSGDDCGRISTVDEAEIVALILSPDWPKLQRVLPIAQTYSKTANRDILGITVYQDTFLMLPVCLPPDDWWKRKQLESPVGAEPDQLSHLVPPLRRARASSGRVRVIPATEAQPLHIGNVILLQDLLGEGQKHDWQGVIDGFLVNIRYYSVVNKKPIEIPLLL